MTFFKESEVTKDSNFHVFIGYDSQNEESFQVLKYSILSQTEDVSVIAIPNSMRFNVPAKAKELGLHGRALYIDSSCLVKGDIKDIFNLTTDMTDERLMWAVKSHDKGLWSCVMVFNLENQALYKMLDPEKMKNWSVNFLFDFMWISRSPTKVDLEVGEIPHVWHFIPGFSEKYVDYNDIRNINYSSTGGPWNEEHRDCKYNKDWWDEYYLFLSNYLLPEVKGRTNADN